MAAKKKTELGPKAKLMKKNVDQLKRQAKRLKIQGFSTKKKEQLVNSIMMAEARAKRKPGTKRKKAVKKPTAVKSVTTRVTMKGKAPRRRKAAPNASRRPNKPMMAGYNGWYNYETWLANLWFDQTFYGLITEEYGEDVSYDQEYDVAESLKYYLEDMVLEEVSSQAGFVLDLLNNSLREINYRELANSVIDTIQG